MIVLAYLYRDLYPCLSCIAIESSVDRVIQRSLILLRSSGYCYWEEQLNLPRHPFQYLHCFSISWALIRTCSSQDHRGTDEEMRLSQKNRTLILRCKWRANQIGRHLSRRQNIREIWHFGKSHKENCMLKISAWTAFVALIFIALLSEHPSISGNNQPEVGLHSRLLLRGENLIDSLTNVF